ncbi:hypothetical protein GTZ99_04340 [Novosphingobium sp. FSY-8]|uniref:Sel1 repeat-containing protein n=1 Tax=Novosphingobium ovatum TaxID=1908523 RepID=A0ABW9XB74_9SPHN|nr:hypothetical protein [Novosphingobium ovatum]NBC35783.1 hypothetical protein [Novosphingobium ovatum]
MKRPALLFAPLFALWACKPMALSYAPSAGPPAEPSAQQIRQGLHLPDCSQGASVALESAVARCLEKAANAGNQAAAMALGDAYGQALIREAKLGKAGATDLFVRQIHWYRQAVSSGQPIAEMRLARALDYDAGLLMPDEALAYFIRAAHHGSAQAAKIIATAWVGGRVPPENITDFRAWLDSKKEDDPAMAQALAMIDQAPKPELMQH